MSYNKWRMAPGMRPVQFRELLLPVFILVAILLLFDISATILRPNLSVLGFPVGTIAMSILEL